MDRLPKLFSILDGKIMTVENIRSGLKQADRIRNRSGLKSAVESPKATFDGKDLYPTIFLKPSAYTYYLAESQAFVDGNKRAALDVALTFLAINGFEVEEEEMEFYDTMIAIAEKRMSKEQLASLFEWLVTK